MWYLKVNGKNYTNSRITVYICQSLKVKMPRSVHRERWLNGKKKGVIVQDPLPGIYVYYQYFNLQGSENEYCRKGFIANLKIYDWDEKIVLRHEDTMPFSVEDRLAVLDKTQLNISPTHGLYSNPTGEIEDYLDRAIQSPLLTVEDYQGIRNVLGVIHDARVIRQVVDLLKDKQIILADGHHRYESSLQYRLQQAQRNPHHSGKEGYNYHLMYFTNTESNDLRILPTHRIVKNLEFFDENELLKKLENYFFITPIEEAYETNEVILGKKWSFGLLFRDKTFKIRLKPEMMKTIERKFPGAVSELDLTVMHHFIIEKCLDIPYSEQKKSRNLLFERNFSKCLSKVVAGNAQCAIITREIPIHTVKEVSQSGCILPQKSTCFYPKVICGFLFGSIKDGDLHSFFDDAFR